MTGCFRKTVLIIPLLVLGIFGCSSRNSGNSNTRAIIGADNRTPVTDSNDTTNSVGYFAQGDVVFCNGFFASASKIMTARHCFAALDDNGDNASAVLQGFSFVAGSHSYSMTGVASISSNADVVELTADSESDKYLNTAVLASGSSLSIYSYTPDKTLTTNSSSSYQDNSDGTFFHQLDTIPSASGSAILQDGNVVGVHIGAVYTDSTLTTVANNIASEPTMLSSATFGNYTTFAGQIVDEEGGAHGGGGHAGGESHSGSGSNPSPVVVVVPQPAPSSTWRPQPSNPPRSVYCMTANQIGTSFVATSYGQVPGAFQAACDSAMAMCGRSGNPNNCHTVSQW